MITMALCCTNYKNVNFIINIQHLQILKKDGDVGPMPGTTNIENLNQNKDLAGL